MATHLQRHMPPARHIAYGRFHEDGRRRGDFLQFTLASAATSRRASRATIHYQLARHDSAADYIDAQRLLFAPLLRLG